MYLLAAGLIIYGNGIAFASRVLFPGTWPFAALFGLFVTTGLIAWGVRGVRLSWRELGIYDAKTSVRGLVLGSLAGIVLAVGALGAIWLLTLPWGGVGYGVVVGVPIDRLLERLLVTMPLDTIIVEEVAFRGVLLALALRVMPPVRAVVVSSVVFMAWHGVVNYDTLVRTALAESTTLFIAGVAAAHLGVFIGGIIFCLIRLRMGGIFASIAAHWAANAVILLAFWTG